jgi:hypothetical protein
LTPITEGTPLSPRTIKAKDESEGCPKDVNKVTMILEHSLSWNMKNPRYSCIRSFLNKLLQTKDKVCHQSFWNMIKHYLSRLTISEMVHLGTEIRYTSMLVDTSLADMKIVN